MTTKSPLLPGLQRTKPADWDVTWVDYQQEARSPATRTHGIDVDISGDAPVACESQLPYPAKRCGAYSIVCRACRKTCIVSTAGRTDDPRSLKMACRPHA